MYAASSSLAQFCSSGKSSSALDVFLSVPFGSRESASALSWVSVPSMILILRARVSDELEASLKAVTRAGETILSFFLYISTFNA